MNEIVSPLYSFLPLPVDPDLNEALRQIGDSLSYVHGLVSENSEGDISNHGNLTGLGDDDHPQYLNEIRGDARYYLQDIVDTFLSNKSNLDHTHDADDVVSGIFDEDLISELSVTQHQAALQITESQITDLQSYLLPEDVLGLSTLADPDADLVLFWDDSAGTLAWLTVGNGLTITDTTLDGVDLLDDLSDVNLTSVQQGETWYFASPSWVNTNQVEILIDNADGPFQQAAGLLSIEAENFHTNTGRSSRDWTEVTSPAGFSGAGAMQALPDGGTNITTNIETTSPEMEYEVIFEETGTHYVWVRAVGVGGGGDTATFGLDGSVIIQFAFGDQGGVDYVWALATSTNIATAGAHIVNIWMREDGAIVDKIVITDDVDFTPTGTGPAESGRAGTAAGARLSLDDTAVLDTVVQDSMPGIQLDPVNDGSFVLTGAGSPEGAVAATQGSLFLRTDGGADTSLYVKESGTGNTGWAAK